MLIQCLSEVRRELRRIVAAQCCCQVDTGDFSAERLQRAERKW